jgi:hypothetical protein
VSRKDYVAIANAIAVTRQQAEAIARNPGLTGISQKAGIASLEAVLDDVTRAIARALSDDNPAFIYTMFLHAADASFLREKGATK